MSIKSQYQQEGTSSSFLNRQRKWEKYTQEKQKRLEYTASVFQRMLVPGSNLHDVIVGEQQTIS